MISNPNCGWCDFDLRTFHGTPSYLTDVPVDLLNAFIQYHSTGTGVAWFDEEGTEFTLVITPYSLFIIEEKDKPVLLDDLCTIIDIQPTAYDIDGVIEQLKRCYGIVRSTSVDYAEGLKDAYERAIGVVKVGGTCQ